MTGRAQVACRCTVKKRKECRQEQRTGSAEPYLLHRAGEGVGVRLRVCTCVGVYARTRLLLDGERTSPKLIKEPLQQNIL